MDCAAHEHPGEQASGGKEEHGGQVQTEAWPVVTERVVWVNRESA